METANKTKKYLSSFLNIALGAGTVIGGAYIFSRINEKQNTETRLDRMEQILKWLSEETESKETESKGS